MTPRQAASFFLDPASITVLEKLTGGNVNDTYLLIDSSATSYILQRINPAVFPEPRLIMENLETVLRFWARRNPGGSGRSDRQISLLSSRAGEKSVGDERGGLWRLMSHCDDTHTRSRVEDGETAAEIGRALGRFHRVVGDLDPRCLHDTLPDFHIAPIYLQRYDRLATLPPAGAEERFCRDFIKTRRRLIAVLEDAGAAGTIRRQVIHGDPKPANFLFDNRSGRVATLIDLDTVKEGLLLYDIGDCLRACCNSGGEEAGEPQQAVFDVDLARSLLTGYVAEAGHLLTVADFGLIFDAVRLLSLELGLRFFTDHLQGNTYFTVRYPGHNLHRALVQFHLVNSIEAQEQPIRRLSARLAAGRDRANLRRL